MQKNFSSIPKELKNLDQWVCASEGTKCPMKAFEYGSASSVDPSTWSFFEQAEWAVNEGYYDYIGFVFADTDSLIGIDIDIGFDEYGLLSPVCADIMTHCKSYTEKSKSGRGVHIFLKGNLPFDGKNNLHGIEIYKSKRFFITTGQQMIYPDIIKNQTAIDYVVNTYFPETHDPVQKSGHNVTQKIYSPEYPKPQGSRIRLTPDYPDIPQGGRHLCLLSLAGGMWQTGYSGKEIHKELIRVNESYCKPMLSDKEVQQIAESITRYDR